jgi:UMF1 family MFS transporter
MTIAKNNPRVMQGWAMYDWANSVYNLVITTAIFPIFYQSQTSVSDKVTCQVTYDKVNFFGFEFINSQLYDYLLAFSYLIVVILAPILSGVADFWGTNVFS